MSDGGRRGDGRQRGPQSRQRYALAAAGGLGHARLNHTGLSQEFITGHRGALLALGGLIAASFMKPPQ
jgi:hypothetical protein